MLSQIDASVLAERKRCEKILMAEPIPASVPPCKCPDCDEETCQCSVDGIVAWRNAVIAKFNGG